MDDGSSARTSDAAAGRLMLWASVCVLAAALAPAAATLLRAAGGLDGADWMGVGLRVSALVVATGCAYAALAWVGSLGISMSAPERMVIVLHWMVVGALFHPEGSRLFAWAMTDEFALSLSRRQALALSAWTGQWIFYVVVWGFLLHGLVFFVEGAGGKRRYATAALALAPIAMVGAVAIDLAPAAWSDEAREVGAQERWMGEGRRDESGESSYVPGRAASGPGVGPLGVWVATGGRSVSHVDEENAIHVPEGRFENSPPFQRWDRIRTTRKVLEGRPTFAGLGLSRPSGTSASWKSGVPPLKRWAIAARPSGTGRSEGRGAPTAFDPEHSLVIGRANVCAALWVLAWWAIVLVAAAMGLIWRMGRYVDATDETPPADAAREAHGGGYRRSRPFVVQFLVLNVCIALAFLTPTWWLLRYWQTMLVGDMDEPVDWAWRRAFHALSGNGAIGNALFVFAKRAALSFVLAVVGRLLLRGGGRKDTGLETGATSRAGFLLALGMALWPFGWAVCAGLGAGNDGTAWAGSWVPSALVLAPLAAVALAPERKRWWAGAGALALAVAWYSTPFPAIRGLLGGAPVLRILAWLGSDGARSPLSWTGAFPAAATILGGGAILLISTWFFALIVWAWRRKPRTPEQASSEPWRVR